MKRLIYIALTLATVGCQSTPKYPLPKTLPHYPCVDDKGEYYACSDQEWIMYRTQEMKKDKR